MDNLVRIEGYYSQSELETIAEKWEKLDDFIRFYSENPPPVPMTPPDDGVYVDDIVSGVVLMRVAQYQVQLFICKPNAVIPDHTHPNADACEVHITGMMFHKNGRTVLNKARIDRRNDDGLSHPHGRVLEIKSTDLHGAECSEKGGAFLTFQKWNEGHDPSSLGIDWDGSAVGEDHGEMIKDGKVFI